MAQLQENNAPAKGGKRRAKRMPFHLDMTPMVDLAFLLLTFFMLTTTFSKFQTMEVNMPADPKETGEPTHVRASDALTIILGEQDKVYYYFGFAGDKPQVHKTDYAAGGIRKVLLSDQVKQNPKAVVLIKPMETSRYDNLVDLLDEIKITDTKKYALVNIDATDKALLATR